MANVKQLPKKHIGKKVTPEQEKEIEKIQKEMKLGTYLEAKHEFFERLEPDAADKIAASTDGDIEKIKQESKKKRKVLTIDQTKLGVTMVLSPGDCKKLGFKGSELTRDVLAAVRQKLGLPEKQIR